MVTFTESILGLRWRPWHFWHAKHENALANASKASLPRASELGVGRRSQSKPIIGIHWSSSWMDGRHLLTPIRIDLNLEPIDTRLGYNFLLKISRIRWSWNRISFECFTITFLCTHTSGRIWRVINQLIFLYINKQHLKVFPPNRLINSRFQLNITFPPQLKKKIKKLYFFHILALYLRILARLDIPYAELNNLMLAFVQAVCIVHQKKKVGFPDSLAQVLHSHTSKEDNWKFPPRLSKKTYHKGKRLVHAFMDTSKS